MYMVYIKGKDEHGKPTLFYKGMSRSIKEGIKKIGQRKGYVQCYNKKDIVFENMLGV